MSKHAAALVSLALVLVGCGESGGTGPPRDARPPTGDDTTVTRIVDGDTLWVAPKTKVRLIGIDTPETQDPRRPVQCFGEQATRRITELVPPGTPVRLVYDIERRDRYDRTLAYVYRRSDGLFVNAALVREGYAAAYTVPPNVAHVDEFVALQRKAREAGRGLWRACGDVGVPRP
jgi:micrococcal nuclease